MTQGRKAIVFGAAAACVYAAMIFGPLATLTEIANAPPLDMRPAGYNQEDARTLLTALGAEGRRIYLWRQIPLDMIYPALLVLTLTQALAWANTALSWPRVAMLGKSAAVLAGGADYIENLGIVAMLLSWPDVSPALVTASSMASVLKSSATTVAVCLLLIFLAARIWRWRAA